MKGEKGERGLVLVIFDFLFDRSLKFIIHLISSQFSPGLFFFFLPPSLPSLLIRSRSRNLRGGGVGGIEKEGKKRVEGG